MNSYRSVASELVALTQFPRIHVIIMMYLGCGPPKCSPSNTLTSKFQFNWVYPRHCMSGGLEHFRDVAANEAGAMITIYIAWRRHKHGHVYIVRTLIGSYLIRNHIMRYFMRLLFQSTIVEHRLFWVIRSGSGPGSGECVLHGWGEVNISRY